MEQSKVQTISGNTNEKNAVDLDQALSVAGLGIYNIKYTLVLALFLIGAIVEPIGYSYILPASRCDLEMTDAIRGFVSSIPYIGIVLTSFPWGYLVDTRGRKMTVIYSSLAAGTLGVVSGFMPNLISFIIFKFLTALCIACPAAVPYTYVGEISPLKYRDIMLTVLNSIQICGAAFVPLLAWAILPLEFEADFGAYTFRSWRLLVMVNSSFFLIAAFLLLGGPESPKYLMSQGRQEESLKVLRIMYAQNKRKSPDDFPMDNFFIVQIVVYILINNKIKACFESLIQRVQNKNDDINSLGISTEDFNKFTLINSLKSTETRNVPTSFLMSLKQQSAPLLMPPHLKWMLLNSFLMFGIFSTLNGLYMWIPDILNRVFAGSIEGTACEVIAQGNNETDIEGAECVDTIDYMTYLINVIATAASGVIAIMISAAIKYIGKKFLLVCVHCIIGIFCILINFVAQEFVFAALLSSIALMGLAIGPVNAYSVQLFPTHLRGMAVGLSMMVGRIGSVAGANIAGALLNSVCEATFYLFGGLLILCGMLSLLLPKSEDNSRKSPNKIVSIRL